MNLSADDDDNDEGISEPNITYTNSILFVYHFLQSALQKYIYQFIPNEQQAQGHGGKGKLERTLERNQGVKRVI